MVRLFRGPRVARRGLPRAPPMMMPRHMRPHEYEPEFIPPPPYAVPRGSLFRGRLIRPGPPRPHLPPAPRMPPPPLPPRHLPFPPRMHMPGQRPIPPPLPHMPPGLPLTRPMRPGPPLARGAPWGGQLRRGGPVKRLGPSANGRLKKTQKRKEKTEGDFFCETCDRSFKTHEKLDEHIAEHQVCGIEGCIFTAHPKIILKHVQIQHESGLYNKIVFTQNPEDVAKWIRERKSRYPTKENVEKKEAQNNEMIKRGERIPKQERTFQRKERYNRKILRKQKSNEKIDSPKSNTRQEKFSQRRSIMNSEGDKWRDPDAWRGDLPKFAGTASYRDIEEPMNESVIEENQFSDDEEWSEKNIVKKDGEKKPFVSNVLALLMANYGSDVSDNDETDGTTEKTSTPVISVAKEIKTDSMQSPEEENFKISISNDTKTDSIQVAFKQNEDLDSGPEECKIDHEDKSNIPILNPRKECEPKPNELKITETRKPMVTRFPIIHQPSLLEKLLKNEIRKERNAILQCVRYVVENNFFGCYVNSVEH